MPYDPRSAKIGGNRGIDVVFSRKAPIGMFRVVVVDLFDGSDFVKGDLCDIKDAIDVANKEASHSMTAAHVYDWTGKQCHSVVNNDEEDD